MNVTFEIESCVSEVAFEVSALDEDAFRGFVSVRLVMVGAHLSQGRKLERI